MAKASDTSAADSKHDAAYRVLARKYRPQNFAQLKGQDALVRTLSNAIETGRIAHAFMLTGVRGVGKTTTARIIARALNCEQGPTVNPCGTCEQCKAIAEDRHVDVLEMDAASHTGVDNIRDLIDTVQYAPVSGRYKVFIIDEVHMLSKGAFNALLKTLEEPPLHVKFVFATTEIRKVPVTVLSRCQRFDLRRIDAGLLESYFGELLVKENVKAEQGALALVARAADGSARDGLSLLDQAISREPQGLTETAVREMLGLVDRSVTHDLYEALMKGDTTAMLALLDTFYKSGADPIQILQDLLELTHYLTKVKVSPDAARDQALPEAERVRGAGIAQVLSIPVLTRNWQMLLKGVSEVQHALRPQQALEMVLIRLVYASDQPTPGDVLKQLKDGSTVSAGGGAMPSGGGAPRGNTIMRAVGGSQNSSQAAAVSSAVIATDADTGLRIALNSFADVAALFAEKRDALTHANIVNYVHPVKFERGHIAIRLKDGAPQTLIGTLSEKLGLWTGERWIISTSREAGAPTMAEQRDVAIKDERAEVTASPIVSEVLKVFPGAKIVEIRKKP
ncbi:MAG: DNA polymerase III subunit gamma/tau [Micavibrio sp.]|nr:DNA polymerase III subunit gamma/tau [Micavibrio sp.]